jgi:hypothetical protein
MASLAHFAIVTNHSNATASSTLFIISLTAAALMGLVSGCVIVFKFHVVIVAPRAPDTETTRDIYCSMHLTGLYQVSINQIAAAGQTIKDLIRSLSGSKQISAHWESVSVDDPPASILLRDRKV